MRRALLLPLLMTLTALLCATAACKTDAPTPPSETESATPTPPEKSRFVRKAPTRQTSKIRLELGKGGVQGAAKQCKALQTDKSMSGAVCRVHTVDKANVVCACSHF